MFLHGGFMHILFNMLMLFFFGPRLEERLGSRTFIRFYLTCGVGGAVLSFATPFSMIVGASGAIFGVVVGFARYWPREEIYIWGVLPVQARVLAIFMVVSSLWSSVSRAPRTGSPTSRTWAGLIAGWIYLRAWERRKRRRRVAKGPARGPAGCPSSPTWKRWSGGRRSRGNGSTRSTAKRWTSCMRKANESGAKALTTDERAFLDRMSGSG